MALELLVHYVSSSRLYSIIIIIITIIIIIIKRDNAFFTASYPSYLLPSILVPHLTTTITTITSKEWYLHFIEITKKHFSRHFYFLPFSSHTNRRGKEEGERKRARPNIRGEEEEDNNNYEKKRRTR
ncbi:hypothetical protein E2C01_078050 [Portunus trituberculatus]|uniref:Uncharacterized protein n=1 Tax=Portunus trituberculatus TaxID=210409 RepID=A0A5B7IHQ4_PORTR|nr:hypothetical protein [Portunus trituberculatus]